MNSRLRTDRLDKLEADKSRPIEKKVRKVYIMNIIYVRFLHAVTSKDSWTFNQ